MTTIPFQELVDFIQSQPDDKDIEMRNNSSSDNCGCILVQFAQKKELPHIACGWTILAHQTQIDDTDDLCSNFIKAAFRAKLTTFRQAKELLSRHLP